MVECAYLETRAEGQHRTAGFSLVRKETHMRIRRRPLWLAGAAAVLALVTQVSAWALATPDPANPVTGDSTYFDGLGAPYGGCGLPQDALDIQDFVALNVYNTPGDYTFYPRPRPASQPYKIGMWNHGLNCGRDGQGTVRGYCPRVNAGAPSHAVWRNGSSGGVAS